MERPGVEGALNVHSMQSVPRRERLPHLTLSLTGLATA